jgi:hypothetical protein
MLVYLLHKIGIKKYIYILKSPGSHGSSLIFKRILYLPQGYGPQIKGGPRE